MVAVCTGIVEHMVVQLSAHVFAARTLVHADVVDIQRANRLQIVGARMILLHAERVAEQRAIGVGCDENRAGIVCDDLCEFGGRVFRLALDKQVGATVCMHVVDLTQQFHDGIDVAGVGMTDGEVRHDSLVFLQGCFRLFSVDSGVAANSADEPLCLAQAVQRDERDENRCVFGIVPVLRVVCIFLCSVAARARARRRT